VNKHRRGRHEGESNVIDASHLFRRDPTPEEAESEFWTWGQDWVEYGPMNLEYLVDCVKEADTEASLRLALTDLRDEVKTYPLDD